ncbi:MAG: PQQ-binding-like beta-propeller repeat protein [Terriglobales bacterium]|jgi:outer membrane protein assembly factor BamB
MKPSRTPSKLSNSCTFLFFAFLLLSGISSATPRIALSKRIGPPTTQVLVSGSGFEPNVGVDIYFDTKDEVLAVTNGNGEFHNAKAYAPRSARPGQHWVTALQRNNDKGAQKPFLVQTDWSQFRYGPEREGSNPFENVLNPQTVGNLKVKWTYNTGFPYASGSPLVVNGMVYVSSDLNLYALNATTGHLRWKFTPAKEDFIDSNPAVANGVLYLGTDYNGLYAFSAQTGAVLWNYTSVNEWVSTPLVADGLVFFGDREGYFYALNAHSGTLVWKSRLGSGNISSPASFANGVVYVAGGDGNLYALNAKTGAKLWMFTNGYFYSASPTVADGVVFLGSNLVGYPNKLYAVNASTGEQLWSYSTSDVVQSSPAVADGVVYVSSEETLYALNAYTGDLLWSYATGAYTLSDATIADGVVYVGSAYPNNVAALNATSGTLLWSYATGGWVQDPTVVNGTVYVASYNDGIVYAFARNSQANSKHPALKELHPDFNLTPSQATQDKVGS